MRMKQRVDTIAIGRRPFPPSFEKRSPTKNPRALFIKLHSELIVEDKSTMRPESRLELGSTFCLIHFESYG